VGDGGADERNREGFVGGGAAETELFERELDDLIGDAGIGEFFVELLLEGPLLTEQVFVRDPTAAIFAGGVGGVDLGRSGGGGGGRRDGGRERRRERRRDCGGIGGGRGEGMMG